VVLAALALAGCGDDENFANDPRPPAPINVSAVVNDERVTVDPASFGGGPVVIRVANLTDETQKVTVKTDQLGADSAGLEQSTPAINPDGTATLKLDMKEGTYSVSVDGEGIDAAKVKVGTQRKSSQDELLLP
jgi:hypothetical protein